jgi:hypothetical protein
LPDQPNSDLGFYVSTNFGGTRVRPTSEARIAVSTLDGVELPSRRVESWKLLGRHLIIILENTDSTWPPSLPFRKILDHASDG